MDSGRPLPSGSQTSMRVDHLSFAGMGPFTEPVEVDIAALPGPLVAITGDNGAGKSTLLELLGGALYRTTATRGDLAELAVTRSAYTRVRLAAPKVMLIEQKVDPVSGKGESLVRDAEGKPLLQSTKRPDYDAWARRYLLPKEVFYTSLFMPQKSGGFLAAGATERAQVLARVLGIERIAVMIDIERKRATALEREAHALDAAIDARRGADPTVLMALLGEARDTERVARAALSAAEVRLADVLREVEATRAHGAAQAQRRAARAHLEERLGDARGRCALLAERVAAVEDVVRDQDAIRDSARVVDTLTTTLVELRNARAAHRDEAAQRLRDREWHLTSEHDARAAREDAAAREARARADLAEYERCSTARATALTLAEQLSVAEAEQDSARVETDRLHDVRLSSADTRISSLRSSLHAIEVAPVDNAHGLARDALAHDDGVAADVEALPLRQRAARDALDIATRKVSSLRSLFTEADALGRQADRFADAAQRLVAARADVEVTTARVRAAEADAERCSALAAEASRKADDCSSREVEVEKELAPHAERAAKMGALTLALAQREDLREQHARARGEVDDIVNQVAALGDEEDLVVVVDDHAARDDVERCQRALGDAIATGARLGEQHAAAVAARDSCVRMSEQRDVLLAQHADAVHLMTDLEAMRALEIDAAGPTLMAVANDILRTCHGPRWSVTIQTTRQHSKQKREIEDFIVLVHDGQSGRTVSGERLSKGEGVVVGESLALAVTVLGCQHAELQEPTLVRDETGDGLSTQNGHVYVAMLRYAAGKVRASKVLLVSHREELAAAADTTLLVQGGRVIAV